MSEGGRIFTLVLVVGGIGTFAYAGPKLVSYFIEGEIRDVFQAKRRSKMIKRLQRHHIVCGCGRVGGEVVRELYKTGVPVVAVDQNPEALRDEVEEMGVPFVVGNAAESSVLEQTNLQNAASLVTCLPNDADNVYICLAVRALRKDLPIIARANSKEAEEHLRKAGAGPGHLSLRPEWKPHGAPLRPPRGDSISRYIRRFQVRGNPRSG